MIGPIVMILTAPGLFFVAIWLIGDWGARHREEHHYWHQRSNKHEGRIQAWKRRALKAESVILFVRRGE